MAGKNSTEALTLQQKIKVITKLFNSGCKTEQELQAMSIEAILKIEGITIQDMTVIMELQKRVKNRTLFSYLGGVEHERESDSEQP